MPARCWSGAPRWAAGEASGGLWLQMPSGIRMRTSQVKSGTCDQRRQTWHPARGCDVDAVSSGSWRRGGSPYVTPPPVDPVGLKILDKCRPGLTQAMSRSGVSKV